MLLPPKEKQRSWGPGEEREDRDCYKDGCCCSPAVHACLGKGCVKGNMLLQAEVCEHGWNMDVITPSQVREGMVKYLAVVFTPGNPLV